MTVWFAAATRLCGTRRAPCYHSIPQPGDPRWSTSGWHVLLVTGAWSATSEGRAALTGLLRLRSRPAYVQAGGLGVGSPPSCFRPCSSWLSLTLQVRSWHAASMALRTRHPSVRSGPFACFGDGAPLPRGGGTCCLFGLPLVQGRREFGPVAARAPISLLRRGPARRCWRAFAAVTLAVKLSMTLVFTGFQLLWFGAPHGVRLRPGLPREGVRRLRSASRRLSRLCRGLSCGFVDGLRCRSSSSPVPIHAVAS